MATGMGTDTTMNTTIAMTVDEIEIEIVVPVEMSSHALPL